MASISEERADQMIAQIMDEYPPGKKRKFLLKQVFTAFMKGMPKKQAVMRANNFVLKYNLDQTDKIPLFRYGRG